MCDSLSAGMNRHGTALKNICNMVVIPAAMERMGDSSTSEGVMIQRTAFRIGSGALRLVASWGGFVLLALACLRAILVYRLKYLGVIVEQLYFIGVQSLAVVVTTGAFAGAVVAYAMHNRFDSLGVGSLTTAVTMKFLLWQIGPVLTGIVLAGRVGCAMAAEIGTLKITEQVDALESFAVDPVAYLIAPKCVAFFVMMPVLVVVAIFAGAFSCLAMVYVMGGEMTYQMQRLQEHIVPYDYVYAIVKGMIFGPMIALICCGRGMKTRGGAGGVGTASTAGNVQSCIAIFISNLFITVLINLAEQWLGG